MREASLNVVWTILEPEVNGNEYISDRAESCPQAAERERSLLQSARRCRVFGVQTELGEKVDESARLHWVLKRVVGLGGWKVLQSPKQGCGAPPMLAGTREHQVLEAQQFRASTGGGEK